MSCMTEVERMIYENCRNVAHGRQTNSNFARITVSPEALAEWLGKHINFCDEFFCENCPYNYEVDGCGLRHSETEKWLEWLKQESDTE